ncbi:MAG: DUF1345 domain-containing protein [Sphingomonadales bacterium]|nr:DUF1345 domain-containing protein [Sphingomonadales bacterium]
MGGIGLFWAYGLGHGRDDSLVTGFDLAALAFIASLWPLRRDHTEAQMRDHAARNDANRTMVLLITGVVMLAMIYAIRGELPHAKNGDPGSIIKLVATLALAWGFTNLVFMLHYAHMHYAPGQGGKPIRGGFDFPGTPDPDYWDFLYFAFTAGMSFAASDVNVTRGEVRRVVVLHCLLSFVFNIGVLAFSINVLAGGSGSP